MSLHPVITPHYTPSHLTTFQIGVFLYFLFMLGMAVYSVSKAVSAPAKLRPEVI